MRLVVSHNNLDFDALASLALARLLHNGAVAVALGGFEEQVRTFVRLYRQHLDLTDARDVEPDKVTELIVVDTADPKRIVPYDAVLGHVPVTVYDHHPAPTPSIPASGGLCRPVGATATILTLLLKQRDIAIAAEVATLGLLGIHEDTGNLSYALTTPEDYEAAAHLLRCGGRLSLVREFSRERYSALQRQVLRQLLASAEERSLKGRRLVVATFASQDYVSGISPLCNLMLEFFDAEVVLLAASMDARSLLIARAKAGTIDVGAALETLGGGGHAVAAFASSSLPLQEALEKSLRAFEAHATPPKRAAELMSRPVVTLEETATVMAAKAKLERYGYSGLPVVDGEGKLTGIISRRDLAKALRHDLGTASIKGYMSKNVITAGETATQRELERLVQEHDIGRIPIMKPAQSGAADPALTGIVTRGDLLEALHEQPQAERLPEEPGWQILSSLPAAALEALQEAKRLSSGALYLVGGTLRDALLSVGMQDLDLVVEGDSAERLGAALQAVLGGNLSCHFDFGTCSLRLPGGLSIDVATAREESYAHPGALPEVTPSNLQRDLARRDFSINALALRVVPAPPELLDPFGGLQDLADKTLRSLHPYSFVEDPTRIIRGARLAARLGLRFHPDTRAQVPAALAPEVLSQVSKSRLRQELLLTCAERRVGPVLGLLDSLEVLGRVFAVVLEPGLIAALDERRAGGDVPDESYLLALLLTLSEEQLYASAQSFHWPRRWPESLKLLREARERDWIEEADAMLLDAAAKHVLQALSPVLAAQLEHFETTARRQRLRGQDVLDLGLEQGPEVGRVLALVARARADGRADSFDSELALAKRLVRALKENDTDRE